MADNILAGLEDTPYSRIADQVIHDITLRARLEDAMEDFERAMRLLHPYLATDPERTVGEALRIMRADKTAAHTTNQPATAGATTQPRRRHA